MRRLVLLTALLVLAVPAAAHALAIGVGDQQPDMFSDPRFLALNIRYARISVAWDVLANHRQARQLDVWLKAARADGVRPLISFDHHFPSRHGRRLPSPGLFAHEFRMLHARYPWVRDFATWNEANYCGEPTCHHPGLVAAYYKAIKRSCRPCTVLAAELLDEPGMAAWVRRFDQALGYAPHLWGLHDYIGANRLQTGSTVALLRATRGQIWLTEVGGLVARHNHSRIGFPQNRRHAARVTRFIFARIARLSRRITRVYVYQWNAGVHRGWDSGLVGPAPLFAIRPAFVTFVHELLRRRQPGLDEAAARAIVQPRDPPLVGALMAGGKSLAGEVSAGATRQRVGSGQRFALALRPGTYVLSALTGGGQCAPQRVTIRRGRGVVTNLACPVSSVVPPAAPR